MNTTLQNVMVTFAWKRSTLISTFGTLIGLILLTFIAHLYLSHPLWKYKKKLPQTQNHMSIEIVHAILCTDNDRISVEL